jgi:hypothetical protein
VVSQVLIVSYKSHILTFSIVEDLKENTIYTNYTTETPVIKWLWEALEEFDNSERAEFI